MDREIIMIGLNLGCGRATFPTTRENPFTNHLLYAIEGGMPQALDNSVDWINIDRVSGPGVQETINLFRYPFIRSTTGKPFDDNSIDMIWLSHIVEHIPHAIKLSDYAGGGGGLEMHRTMYDRDGDGWFAFHYECWRILKPGGRLAVLYPYAMSAAGIADPTHTRYVMPASFSYFIPNPDAPFDYGTPFQFKMITTEDDPTATASGLMRITNDGMEMQAAIDAQQTILDGLAPYHPKRRELEGQIGAARAYLNGYAIRHFGQLEEGFYVFQAIK